MPRSSKTLWWIPAGIIAITIGVYVYWSQSQPHTPSHQITQPIEFPKSEIPASRTPDLAPRGPRQPDPTQATPLSKSSTEQQCTQDTECTGPKLADCILFRCTEGTCEYDKSNCECQRNEDCDDSVTCTRDLCFVNTMRCIHVKENCE